MADIYLHHVLDEWFENKVKPRLRGAAHEIRFADDAMLCFQYKEDGWSVRPNFVNRFGKTSITLFERENDEEAVSTGPDGDC